MTLITYTYQPTHGGGTVWRDRSHEGRRSAWAVRSDRLLWRSTDRHVPLGDAVLLDHLDIWARCPRCSGAGLVVWSPVLSRPVPYDPEGWHRESPSSCERCLGEGSDLPREFSEKFHQDMLAGFDLGTTWKLTSVEIESWYRSTRAA